MTSIQPDAPENEEAANEFESIDDMQSQDSLSEQRPGQSHGVSSGPIIINRNE